MAKLNWALIGGGEGSQIGPAHRLAAALDGEYSFVAGALDHRPEKGKEYGISLGLAKNRSYGDWREFISAEKDKAGEDRVDLVTVATPNHTHFEITTSLLDAGFHVLCEKPLANSISECKQIIDSAKNAQKLCGVNYGYSGYSLVRQMRGMISSGALGNIRLVVAEFAHGHHADTSDAGNSRVRGRYDPKQMGVSAQFADCGIHALHMVCFVTGQKVESLSADICSCVAQRELEDDAMVNFRLDKGTVGRLWTSSIAIGRQHGLTIQVFGEKGGLRWSQEQPNQLFWMPLGERLQVIERGDSTLLDDAVNASRVTIGHAEGMPLAFANIYKDFAGAIKQLKAGEVINKSKTLLPDCNDGLESILAVHGVAESGKQRGKWIDLAQLNG